MQYSINSVSNHEMPGRLLQQETTLHTNNIFLKRYGFFTLLHSVNVYHTVATKAKTHFWWGCRDPSFCLHPLQSASLLWSPPRCEGTWSWKTIMLWLLKEIRVWWSCNKLDYIIWNQNIPKVQTPPTWHSRQDKQSFKLNLNPRLQWCNQLKTTHGIFKGIVHPKYKITYWFPYPVSSLWTRYDSNPKMFPHANVLAFVAQITFKSWDRDWHF